jgi:hypothetical protein
MFVWTLKTKSLLPSLYKREEFPLFQKEGSGEIFTTILNYGLLSNRFRKSRYMKKEGPLQGPSFLLGYLFPGFCFGISNGFVLFFHIFQGLGFHLIRHGLQSILPFQELFSRLGK